MGNFSPGSCERFFLEEHEDVYYKTPRPIGIGTSWQSAPIRATASTMQYSQSDFMLPSALTPLVLGHSGHTKTKIRACGQKSLTLQLEDIEANETIVHAQHLMEDYNLLAAANLLSQKMSVFEASGFVRASRRLVESAVFGDVFTRLGRYEQASVTLNQISQASQNTGEFSLIWEQPNAKLWVYAPPDSTWFQTRLLISMDAPLHQCLCAINEYDLQPRWQPLLVEPPTVLARQPPLRQVIMTLQSVMMFTVELIFEVLRVPNLEYGALVENISSDFPIAGISIPDKSWLRQRVEAETQNIWIPRGGGTRGTLLVQISKMDAGFQVPAMVRDFVVDKGARSVLDKLEKAASMVGHSGPDNVWRHRLQEDRFGLYKLAREIEAVAAQRSAVDIDKLPPGDVFTRLTSLQVPKHLKQEKQILPQVEVAESEQAGWFW